MRKEEKTIRMRAEVTPLAQISIELTEIQKYLEITISGDNGEEIKERGNNLIVYLARSGNLLVDAKLHYRNKLKSEIMTIVKDQARQAKVLSATAINRLIESLCADEIRISEWAERVNRSCTHQIDWCRSVLSTMREEMKHLNMK